MKRQAAFASLLLCALFVAVYPTCNWLTSQRANVGTWSFTWEQHIPFIPWMIVPYWSIDVFFVCAPFVCRDRAELRMVAQRISFAILVAGACFLAFPLRIVFPRPEVSGLFGAMFNLLRSFDQPHNLFPSLHITLWLILWSVYIRNTHGFMRGAVKLWFVLIGLSTVLTWQHQVIDVAGGVVLATLCYYLFRETPLFLPVTRNWWVGTYYAIGSLIAAWIGGVLWWAAISFGTMAVAYWGLGPGVFRKENGGLPLSVKLLLGPVLLGQWCSLFYYRRQCRAWDTVVPGVLIGRVLTEDEAMKVGADAVLDLTAEFSETQPFLIGNYRNIPILDLTAPTPSQLSEAVAFIREQVGQGKTVYVHCKIGYSRSAAVVGAYLLAAGKANTVEQAVKLLREARPSVVIRPEAMSALSRFMASG